MKKGRNSKVPPHSATFGLAAKSTTIWQPARLDAEARELLKQIRGVNQTSVMLRRQLSGVYLSEAMTSA